LLIWKNLGAGYFCRKEYGQAAACYKKALAIAPDDPDARKSALTIFAAAGDTVGMSWLQQKNNPRLR